MAKKYRKKPVVVEAFQLNRDELPIWFAEALVDGKATLCSGLSGLTAEVETPEGRMYVHYTDYIIRGVKGEIYPCKCDIFEQTYEETMPVVSNTVTISTMGQI